MSSSSVLQAERKAVPNLRTTTNPVRISFVDRGLTINPPPGTIAVSFQTSPALRAALGAEDIDIEMTNPDTGLAITTGFDANTGNTQYPNEFDLRVGLPANITPSVYLLRVTAWYLSASSTLLVPLEISENTRGSL